MALSSQFFGAFFVLLGIPGLFFPFMPGWPILALGTLLLSANFPFFDRMVRWIENRGFHPTERSLRNGSENFSKEREKGNNRSGIAGKRPTRAWQGVNLKKKTGSPRLMHHGLELLQGLSVAKCVHLPGVDAPLQGLGGGGHQGRGWRASTRWRWCLPGRAPEVPPDAVNHQERGLFTGGTHQGEVLFPLEVLVDATGHVIFTHSCCPSGMPADAPILWDALAYASAESIIKLNFFLTRMEGLDFFRLFIR